MINLQLNLRIPGSDRFRNLGCWHGIIPCSHHKFWEIQCYQSSDLLDFFLRATCKQSHAGIEIGFGIFGFNIEFRIYDNRHWNKEKKGWEI